MNSINKRLEKIKKEKRIGLMTHVIVGYPSIKETISMVEVMDEAGVDFVELQIPFSDPLADGPTIMKACEDALERGVRVRDAFVVASKLSSEVDVPLIFMAYYNTVFKYGVEKFCRDAYKAGVVGLIVPDISLEEDVDEGFTKNALKYQLHVIRVVSPVSTDLRLKNNSDLSSGFIYCTARQGTTGNQKKLDPKVITYLKNVRKISKVPLAVGFGIKSREDVSLVKEYADIAVVGSAIVSIAAKHKGESLKKEIRNFLSSIRV